MPKTTKYSAKFINENCFLLKIKFKNKTEKMKRKHISIINSIQVLWGKEMCQVFLCFLNLCENETIRYDFNCCLIRKTIIFRN